MSLAGYAFASGMNILPLRVPSRFKRYISIALQQKICPNATKLIESEHKNYIGAEQAGHSWAVEKKVYKLLAEALAGPSKDILPI